MKIHALITSIVIAAGSTAMADDYALEHKKRIDERFDATRMPARTVWSPVTKMIDAQLTTAINIKECCDELRMLRFQNGKGATYVYSVTLELENGAREKVNVGQWLYWDQQTLAVDIPDRRVGVNRLLVHTWTWFPSTFQVFAKHVERPPLPLPPPPPPPVANVMIGKDLTFARTAGYVQIPVGAEKGTFAKLHVEGIGAITYIGKIYVTFANGTNQTFAVAKPLRRGEDLLLDLSGERRAIRSVTLMAGDDLQYVGHASSRFSVSLR